jgi:hypothetical protein
MKSNAMRVNATPPRSVLWGKCELALRPSVAVWDPAAAVGSLSVYTALQQPAAVLDQPRLDLLYNCK